jgi:hypothetical protein
MILKFLCIVLDDRSAPGFELYPQLLLELDR